MKLLESLECNIGTIVTVLGFIFAIYLYFREVRSKKVKKLARQIIAFYSEEQEAIKEIQKYTGEKHQTIMKRLRNNAVKNDNNLEGEYPFLTAKGARKKMSDWA